MTPNAKSLVKKERGCLFKGYTDLEQWQVSAIKSHSFKNVLKHTVLPPWAKPGQFQNTPEVPSFRKAEVCGSAFLVSSAFQASPTNPCLVRQVLVIPSTISRATMFSGQVSQQISFFLLQLLIQTRVALSYAPDLTADWGILLHPFKPRGVYPCGQLRPHG